MPPDKDVFAAEVRLENLHEMYKISVCVLTCSQSCHFRLAKLRIEPPAGTVDLRMVPKNTKIHPAIILLSQVKVPTVEKRANYNSSSLPMHMHTRHVVLAGRGNTASIYCLLGMSSDGACAALLLQSG